MNKKTKKYRKSMKSTRVDIQLTHQPLQKLSGSEALLLGKKCFSNWRFEDAIKISDSLIEAFPNSIDCKLLKLESLISTERIIEAKEFSKQLMNSNQKNIAVLTSNAQLQLILNKPNRALKLYSVALKQEKHNIGLILQIAECFASIGNSESSLSSFEQALQLLSNQARPSQELLINTLTGLGRYKELSPKQYGTLKKLLFTPSLKENTKIKIAYFLAEQAKKHSDLTEELNYLHQANSLIEKKNIAQAIQFNQNHESKRLKSVYKNFPLDKPSSITVSNNYSSLAPIFILAMPRSGTTLLEQILGAHSQIGQTGESGAMPSAINLAYKKQHYPYGCYDFPIQIDRLSKESLSEVGQHYIKYQQLLTEKSHFVDKELSAYWHVGLSAKIFPNAKFIHVNRAPGDIFVSCFQNNIPGASSCSSIENLAHHYITMKKLIGHWQQLLPDQIYIVNYENLVDNLENEAQQLFKFLGLEWEASVTHFYKRANVVRTPSVNQVRKSISKQAIGKSKRYAELLKPAFEIISNEGWSIDQCRFL